MAGRNFTFHILGYSHLPAARKYLSCAFTQKAIKLAKMLCALGHTVYYYGCRSTEESPIEEYVLGGLSRPGKFNFIETHSVNEIADAWGDGDNRFEVGYDWTNSDFRHDYNTQRKPVTLKFYQNCIDKLLHGPAQPDHFLLCMQGSYHSPIAEAVKLFLTCEPGIGYRGSVAGRFRAFESAHIQSYTYGSETPFQDRNGSYYDRVIPNYFDLEHDILYSDKKQDYYLFIGRMIKRKGILTAALTCNHLGKKLIIAGQGAHVDHRGYLVPNEDPDFELPPGTWEYVGYADVNQRKKLMAGAIATFVPTEYLECFGGTHVESMLSGTPAITTNFGVFPGTIPEHVNGRVGFRCNTLQDFVDAARDAVNCHPETIWDYARRLFSMGAVMHQFDDWFHDLYNVYESAHDPTKKGWHRLQQ